MARYDCVRCGEGLNTTMPPHLCRDIAQRLDEATKRANVPCRGVSNLEGWEKRMQYECGDPRPPRRLPMMEWRQHHKMWVEAGTRPA